MGSRRIRKRTVRLMLKRVAGCSDRLAMTVECIIPYTSSEAKSNHRCRLPLIGGSAARIFSPHTVEDLSLHLAQLDFWEARQGLQARPLLALGMGCGPFEQFFIHCLGRAVHVVDDGDEPLQPKQVPGDF